MLYLLGITDLHDIVDDVAGVLVQRVVAGAVEARARSVVVDAESAADIEVAEGMAHLAELRVKTGGLSRGTADGLDIGHLGTDMVVEKDKRIGHTLRMERVAHGDEIGGRETELGVLPAAGGPLAGPFGEKADAGADHRLDPDLLGHGEDLMEFLQLLDDEDNFLAKLEAEQGGADEFVILVAVADHKTLGVGVDGERGDHLRLAPGLDAEVVGNAGVDDLLHDLAELVHLDREDAAVVVLVTAFRNGAGKGFVETAHTVAGFKIGSKFVIEQGVLLSQTVQRSEIRKRNWIKLRINNKLIRIKFESCFLK